MNIRYFLQRVLLGALFLLPTTLFAQGGTIGAGAVSAASVLSGTFPSGTYSFTGAVTLTGGAGNMTLTAGTGASRTMTLQGTDAGGVARNALVAIDSQVQVTDGRQAKPGYAFSGSTSTGFYRASSLPGVALTIAGGAATWTASASNMRIIDGSGGAPGLVGSSNNTTGLWWGPSTLGFSTGGVSTATFTGGASATLTGGAGNMTIQAGTGNSRTMTLQTTTSAGTATTALRFNEVQQSLLADGINSRPGVAFAADTATGIYRGGAGDVAFTSAGVVKIEYDANAVTSTVKNLTADGTAAAPSWGFSNGASGLYNINNGASDTLGIAINGANAFKIPSAGVLVGPAGNTTFLAGTGNNRSLTLQSSNSSGTATTFAQGSGDTLKLAGHAIFSGLTAASGTPNSVCLNSATKELTENAATSCAVSSMRFKRDTASLTSATARNIVFGLKPFTFTYKEGGRKSVHFIAEQAEKVDKRLVFYDAQGRANSVDDNVALTALLKVVQDQQVQINELRAQIAALRK